MPLHSFRVGKGARFSYRGSNLLMQSGNVIESADDLDGGNTESGGAEEGDLGLDVVNLDVNLFWDPTNNYAALNLVTGIWGNNSQAAATCDIRLYINVTDSTFWAFPELKIISAGPQIEVRRIIVWPVRAKSNGPYYRPDGTKVGS